MEVWGIPVLADVEQVVDTLREQVHINGSHLLKDKKYTHNNIMLTCISHGEGQERNPSMGISTAETLGYKGEKTPAGTCHCFTCGYTADLPTFVSNVLGYNDGGMQGYKWIMRNFVTIEIENRTPLEIDMTRDEPIDLGIEVVDPITEEELDQYRYTHSYMYERKLTDKVIEYFDVGYDSKTNALTFPVYDLDGKVRLIQRRSVQGKRFINDEGGSKGDYVYGLYQVYKNLSWIKEIYVTESPIDALTLWTHRIPAVSIMGARLTMIQADLLKNLPVRKIILALDNDEAGESGKRKIAKQLQGIKLLYEVVFPEDVKDINDMTEEQVLNMETKIFI